MELSSEGMEMLKTREGLRLSAYKDTKGIWTIGYGHTKDVHEGDTCTEEQASQWLFEDLNWAEFSVNHGIDGIPTTQGQYDSMVSLCFNIGATRFLNSTLLKYHRARAFYQAALEFPKWCHEDGQINKGLLIRRFIEATHYLS